MRERTGQVVALAALLGGGLLLWTLWAPQDPALGALEKPTPSTPPVTALWPSQLSTAPRLDLTPNVDERAADEADFRSAVQKFLLTRPGSPFALLPEEEAAAYLPTRESLAAWVADVDELADIDPESIEWTDDVAHLWQICREEQALHSFILDHADRERERWQNREQSVSLEAELMPVREFMDRNLGNSSDVWELVSSFSGEVQSRIRGEGENADDGDDEESRWTLYSALVRAGSPSFDAVAELLRKD